MKESLKILEESHDSNARHLFRLESDVANANISVPALKLQLAEATDRYGFFQVFRAHPPWYCLGTP